MLAVSAIWTWSDKKKVQKLFKQRNRLDDNEFAGKYFPVGKREIVLKLKGLIGGYLNMDCSQLLPSDSLSKDLKIDSDDAFDMLTQLEKELKVEIDYEKIKKDFTFQDIISAIK